MIVTSTAESSGTSLMLVESGLTLVVLGLAFALPRLGSRAFSRVERAFACLARRRRVSVASVGAAAFVLRIALLPLLSVPLPFLPGDFSFLLAADTFAHGRLANRTPPMWMHLETIHVSMQPTYMSMYFPAGGLVLAAGKLLFGDPWLGILVVTALMCAAICWMLQGWLPPQWALLGGLLAILRIGLFSYWVDTYSAASSLAALAGALVLGAVPRLAGQRFGSRTRSQGNQPPAADFGGPSKPRAIHALLLGAGMALLVLSRPYEGVLLCLPVAVRLAHWALRGAGRPSPAHLARLFAAPAALVLVATAWLGYYDLRAFHNPLTLPYTVNRAQYAMAPYYVWQQPRPEPAYRHAEMRRFYYLDELDDFRKIHSLSGFVPFTLAKLARCFEFFAGAALLVPLIMLRRVLLDRRVRFLAVCVLVLAAGMAIENFVLPHYLAPFTAAFYAIGLQAMRHLFVWRPRNQPSGAALVRFTAMNCLILAALRPFAGPLNLSIASWPSSQWIDRWYGPGRFGTERDGVLKRLERLPGRQLAIVRYSDSHNPLDEWVYNDADIDDAKVVWAREMSDADNRELTGYFRDRTVWLVQPDSAETMVSPWPKSAAQAAR